MTNMLTGWAARLLLGSFFIFAVQALGGSGSLRVPLSLAGACMMTILLLQPISDGQLPVGELADLLQEAEQTIDLSVEAAMADSEQALYDGVAEELAAMLQTNGIACRLELEYGDNGALTGARLWTEESRAEEAAGLLSSFTGLEHANIRFMGEVSDGYR